MLSTRIPCTLFFLLGPAPVIAQEPMSRSLEVAAGQQVRLGSFANLKPDCSPGPLPEVTVSGGPKAGVVEVRRSQGKMGPGTRCPKVDAQAQIVMFRAYPSSAGQDEVSFEVKLPDGNVVRHQIRITITPEAVNKKKPDEP